MEQTEKNTESNDLFSSMLGGILSNPEMMSAISSMAQKLKGSDATFEQSSQPSEPDGDAPKDTAPPEELSDAIRAISPLLSGKGLRELGADDEKARLLRALKPYLSKSRCEAIDQIISVSKLSHLLKNNNGR